MEQVSTLPESLAYMNSNWEAEGGSLESGVLPSSIRVQAVCRMSWNLAVTCATRFARAQAVFQLPMGMSTARPEAGRRLAAVAGVWSPLRRRRRPSTPLLRHQGQPKTSCLLAVECPATTVRRR